MAVKTEEMDGPRIHMVYDTRIQMMYREDLSEEREREDSSEDSSSESSSGDYEELASEFADIMAEVEEQRKEKEKRHVEKQLRIRKPPGLISYGLVWSRGWRAAFKKRRAESPKRELNTEKEEKKEAVW